MTKISSTIRTSQKKKDKKYNIKISIFHNGDTRFIGTKFNVLKSQFAMKEGRVRKTHPLASFINAELKILESRYDTKILQIENINRLNVSEIIKLLKQKKQIINIYDLFDERIKELKKIKGSTWEKYYYTSINIKKFHGSEFLNIYEVDELFLAKFQKYFYDKGNSINSVSIDLRNIRAIFNQAINEKLVSADYYPFRKFKIPIQKTKKRNLAINQIKKIYNYNKPLSFKEERAKDIFLLSFFLIGINLTDLFYLKSDNIINDRLEYERAKTHKLYSIKLYPETKKLIDKYKDEDNNEFLLNFYKSYSYSREFVKSTNKFLNQFVSKLEISERVTSYFARHSWATIAYNTGIDKDTVRLALGHGTESVTDTYIDFDLKRVDEANRKIIDLII